MCKSDGLTGTEQTFTRLIERYAVELPERLTLESAQDFIYLSDLHTYELYLISMENPSDLRDEWKDYQGKHCYELLQNRSEPCPFCTNHLLERDIDYIWKIHNDIVNADYILKDRLVDWQGKTVRMEVVINLSDPHRIDTVLQRSLATQNVLTGCLRQLFQTMDLKDGCEGVLQKIGPFFGAESGFVQCFGAQTMLARWNASVPVKYKNAIAAPTEAAAECWNELLGRGQQVIIKNIDELQEDDAAIWKALKEDHAHSLCATPVYAGQKLAGFIFLRNITKNWTEVSMLTMLAGFISMMLQKASLEQEKLRLQYYDDVAHCLNFEGFRKKAGEILRANTNRSYALWYCDIKNFKYINDVFGYDVGDQLLQYWSRLRQENTQEEETFGRIAGDNFVALCWYQTHEELTERFRAMSAALSAFGPTSAQKYRIDVVSGVYLLNDTEVVLSLDEMLNRANMAQKSVKELPGSQLGFYDGAMRCKILNDLQLEAEMQDALKNQDFVLYLQPQVALGQESALLRAEALVRWQRKDGTLLPPGGFIELFERDGLIVDLDRYVFEGACKFVREWMEAGKPALCLAVNVSRISMLQTSFVEDYCRIKAAYEIPDGLLELEFTETIAVENYMQFRDTIRRLQARGFLCAMDDFGTCQSSLNLLKNLPLDVLKIDRMFFLADGDPKRGMAVVNCVLQLAQSLDMHTVAEGIETEQLVEHLRDMGCDRIQGFVFARPMPAERFFNASDSELAVYSGSIIREAI